MRHFCTLFDSRYLTRGLVLYDSLMRHASKDFRLYVLPMDEECARTLLALALPRIVIIDLERFESVLDMAGVKASRTHQEYCWTAASNFAYFLMLRAQLDIPAISYLDADLFFFADPDIIFREIGGRSIAIIPHRFIPEKRYLAVNGEYNVSWVTFKNSSNGRNCLVQWAEDCRRWCYNRVEDDRFADQRYLDAWPGRYGDDLRVIENIGAGLAPWNVGSYDLTHNERGLCVNSIPVVFYHYHEFEPLENGQFRLTNYILRDEDVALIYKPYIHAYQQAKMRIEALQSA